MASGKFEFKGNGLSFWWLMIWTSVLTIITLGLYFPWAYVQQLKWIFSNVYINGKRLVFKGSGAGFFGNYLLIFILTIITFGLYSPWGVCRIMRWTWNNTYFAENGDIENF